MKFTVILLLLLLFTSATHAQNCCAPSVPQQGILGETVSLPHVLDVGLHYQYLRSDEMYEGTDPVNDSKNTVSEWKQAMLTLSYGIVPGLSAAAVVPYVEKNKRAGADNHSSGIGDVTFMLRYSPIARSFVSYKELTIGAGVKIPTGATDAREFGFKLPMELQPGSGSWDYNFSASFFLGFEPADFVVSANYTLTTPDEGYEFGNSLTGLLTANVHAHERLDVSIGLSGVKRGKDMDGGKKLATTGRDQIWFVPGVRVVVIPLWIDLQFFYEHPIYQRFNGMQLAGDHNLRVSTTISIPFASSEQ